MSMTALAVIVSLNRSGHTDDPVHGVRISWLVGKELASPHWPPRQPTSTRWLRVLSLHKHLAQRLTSTAIWSRSESPAARSPAPIVPGCAVPHPAADGAAESPRQGTRWRGQLARRAIDSQPMRLEPSTDKASAISSSASSSNPRIAPGCARSADFRCALPNRRSSLGAPAAAGDDNWQCPTPMRSTSGLACSERPTPPTGGPAWSTSARSQADTRRRAFGG